MDLRRPFLLVTTTRLRSAKFSVSSDAAHSPDFARFSCVLLGRALLRANGSPTLWSSHCAKSTLPPL